MMGKCCVEINQCAGSTDAAVHGRSSGEELALFCHAVETDRVDGVEVDAKSQRDNAVKFWFPHR